MYMLCFCRHTSEPACLNVSTALPWPVARPVRLADIVRYAARCHSIAACGSFEHLTQGCELCTAHGRAKHGHLLLLIAVELLACGPSSTAPTTRLLCVCHADSEACGQPFVTRTSYSNPAHVKQASSSCKAFTHTSCLVHPVTTGVCCDLKAQTSGQGCTHALPAGCSVRCLFRGWFSMTDPLALLSERRVAVEGGVRVRQGCEWILWCAGKLKMIVYIKSGKRLPTRPTQCWH
jgi:hypothetical protein